MNLGMTVEHFEMKIIFPKWYFKKCFAWHKPT